MFLGQNCQPQSRRASARAGCLPAIVGCGESCEMSCFTRSAIVGGGQPGDARTVPAEGASL